jgi:hypothetical protein
MSGLGDRIRAQASISARPGQLRDLEQIAAEVDTLVDALSVRELPTRDEIAALLAEHVYLDPVDAEHMADAVVALLRGEQS